MNKITAYITTDGQLFKRREDAERHMSYRAFAHWYYNEASKDLEPTSAEMYDWLKENKIYLIEFLKKC